MIIASVIVPLAPSLASAQASGVPVSTGSPPGPFPQNKQNEPAVAIDPLDPRLVVAGANDEIDLAPCAGSSCPFTSGVGISGVYFSANGGASWSQPTYSGFSARTGTGGAGPIGTLPGYFQAGLVSDGDPALAFGPKPANGHFSWANGVRLCYGNLTENFPGTSTFNGFEAIAVSRTDDLAGAMAGMNGAWMAPVIVSRQNSALFSDKDAVWADNAATSPFFGRVYACNVAFRGQEKSPKAVPEPVMVATSADGGSTWTQVQVSAVTNNIVTGAPAGTGATNEILVTWTDARAGLNKEQAFLEASTNGGQTYSTPAAISQAGDRANQAAIAITPTGTQAWLTYNAYLQPWQTTTAAARAELGVVRMATISNGIPGGFSTVLRGATGDARASSANGLSEEFLGDYNDIKASANETVAVWNDTRNATDCQAIDVFRQSLVNGSPITRPAPATDCAGTFGNSDIFAGSF